MKDKSCPRCGRKIGIGVFLGAITGGKSRLSCPHCGAVVKRDLSLFTGLFFVGFASVVFPVMVVFGLGKNVAGRSLERIQKIFDVGPDAAFAIGIGTIIGFVLLYYLVYGLIYLRLEFDD